MKEKTEKIFIFNCEEEAREKYRNICQKLNISVEFLGEDAYKKQLGIIIGANDFLPKHKKIKSSKPLFKDIFMLFYGIEKERLDEVLLALKKAKTPKVIYKAIVTKTNIKWTLEALLKELKKEHDEMIKFLNKIKDQKREMKE